MANCDNQVTRGFLTATRAGAGAARSARRCRTPSVPSDLSRPPAVESTFMDCPNPPGPHPDAADLYRLLIENIRDYAIFTMDAGRRVITWNAGAERLLGYAAGEIVGRTSDCIFTPEDLAAGEPERAARQALETGQGDDDRWHVRKDGSRFWAGGAVTPLRDAAGTLLGFAKIMRDRTGWRREMDARRASEARQAAILETAPDPIITTDHEGKVAGFNPAAERVFGFRRADVMGRPLGDFVAPPADGPRGIANYLPAGDGPVPEGRLELPARRADGTEFPVELTVARLRTDGPPVFTAFLRDVTEQKSADRSRAARLAVVQALTRAGPTAETARDILQAVGANLGWEVGVFWSPDPDAGVMRLLASWHAPDLPASEVEAQSRGRTFGPGDGMVGRAWATGAPAWVTDVTGEAGFAAAAAAARADGLRTAFVYPVVVGDATPGVLEFFCRRPREPDAATLDLMAAVGVKVGHYLERRRAEELLRASEARLRSIIETTPQCIKLIAADGTVLEMNAPGLAIVEAGGADEVIGRDVFALVAPEDRDRYRAFHAAVCGGWTGTAEFAAVGLRGTRRILEATAAPFKVNGAMGQLCVSQDVTERRRAEAQLQMRDRAIQAISEGILITDATRQENPIVYVSPGFERLTGYTQAEAEGKNCRFLQGKDTDPGAVAELRQAVRDGRPCAVEILNYRKDGTAFWNALSVTPVWDGGRLTHYVGVQADVTGRRRLEEQFRQAQKMEAVGQLAAGVAHDFNNHLTVINGYSEMALDALPAADPMRDLLREINKAGRRAATLTRQLLLFTRQQVLDPRILDLNAVVGDTGNMLRRLIGEDVRLATHLDAALAPVKADLGQVEQVVINLCVNARDAMPAGGNLTIETRNVTLDETYARTRPGVHPGAYAMLAVSDTGAGMDEAVRARIFEPFFTTKQPGKGTGLGLPVVFGAIKHAGGHVEVYTEVGRGTTFKVYFPQARERPAAGKASPAAAPMPRGTETLLLVEDEDALRALARHVLKGCGYAVLEAADGREAVRLVEAHRGPLHLLVSDVVMPYVGGRELSEKVAALRPDTRVLFLSGYTDDAVVRHGVLEAEVAFLQKPFTPSGLAVKVREVLDQVR